MRTAPARADRPRFALSKPRSPKILGALSLASIPAFIAFGAGTPHRTAAPSFGPARHTVPLGAFLGSGSEGVEAVGRFQSWLGSPVDVGHTYLPGNSWRDIEGAPAILSPWLAWKRENPRKLLVLNMPMLPNNEDGVDDGSVSAMLGNGAGGADDQHFKELAKRLAAGGARDAVIVPGWEMNGATYTSRCGPNPAKWIAYWRRIVTAMRAVPGTRFRFDFTVSRGLDAIPWPHCYPGDDVVDIIGSDNYDQPEGAHFTQFVQEPYGLGEQARFATEHNKPMSFPEWGMFRNSDDPGFVKSMYDWISTHSVAYQTITDYCPHGVWGCQENPRASAEYRRLFGGHGVTSPPAPAKHR
ncbi:glycosyl hydrolase family 26 [Spirillospora sp. NPDC052269]